MALPPEGLGLELGTRRPCHPTVGACDVRVCAAAVMNHWETMPPLNPTPYLSKPELFADSCRLHTAEVNFETALESLVRYKGKKQIRKRKQPTLTLECWFLQYHLSTKVYLIFTINCLYESESLDASMHFYKILTCLKRHFFRKTKF